MQSKQAETVLSDLIVKCEEADVALPKDPWSALEVALAAIKAVQKRDVKRQQVEEALASLSSDLGVSARVGRPKKRAKAVKAVEEVAAASPKAKRAKAVAQEPKPTPASTKKNKKETAVSIQEQVRAAPAVRKENQALVDKVVALGEFEMRHGHSQRGLARMRAAKQLRDAAEVITSGAQAQTLEHVGPSAAAKIDAILADGLDAALREYADEQ